MSDLNKVNTVSEALSGFITDIGGAVLVFLGLLSITLPAYLNQDFVRLITIVVSAGGGVASVIYNIVTKAQLNSIADWVTEFATTVPLFVIAILNVFGAAGVNVPSFFLDDGGFKLLCGTISILFSQIFNVIVKPKEA